MAPSESRGDTAVAFIGIGKIGRPMAERVARADFDLAIYDLDASARAAFGSGPVRVAGSAREAAASSEIVCLCLPGPPEVEELVFGDGGIFSSLRAGALLVDHTTGSPRLARRAGAVLPLRDAAFLDAPVSGGVEGATAGTLTTLVGGVESDLDRARPVLEAFSSTVVHVGPTGAGTIAKLMNNLACFTLDQVIAECLSIGLKAGVEPEALLAALQASAIGQGGNLHVRIPDTFMRNDFEPRFTLAGARKDLSLAVELADELDVPAEFAQKCLDALDEAYGRGDGDRDASIAMTLQEERAGVRVRPPSR